MHKYILNTNNEYPLHVQPQKDEFNCLAISAFIVWLFTTSHLCICNI